MKLSEKVDLFWDTFHGRRDLYGIIRTKFDASKRKPIKEVSPVFLPKFRDKDARRDKEFNSPEELFDPLTKEKIKEHLLGNLELMIYMPRYQTHKTNFAAMDFDSQHGFSEVVTISSALDLHKIPHAIARSTTKGFHIYLFFKEEIDSYLITNFINLLYTEVGYIERQRNNQEQRVNKHGEDKPALWTTPEVFPKTIFLNGPTSTGYGIKPPFNGRAAKENQCCFVDINNVPIGGAGTSEEQWEYLKNVPRIDPVGFENYIVNELKLEISKDLRMSELKGAVISKRVVPYKEPEDGDFLQIIKGCPALHRLWTGPIGDWGHDTHVAMLSFALSCKGGLELLKDKYINSNFYNPDVFNVQVQHGMDTNQHPWTCRTLQVKGICLVGFDPKRSSGKREDGKDKQDFCFEKTPPREFVGGKLSINPNNIPEEDWPEPSPARLRIAFSNKGIVALKKEIDGFTKDDPDLDVKLESIFRKIASLKDAKSKDEMFEYIKGKKLVQVSALKEFQKNAKKQQSEEIEKEMKCQDGYRSALNNVFTTSTSIGYNLVTVDSEGVEEFKAITDFEIEFEEDVAKHPSEAELRLNPFASTTRTYQGYIKSRDRIRTFSIATDAYNDNRFATAIRNANGIDSLFFLKDIDLVRHAIGLFGMGNCKKVNIYEDYGFDSVKKPTIYRSGSGMISSEGFIVEEREISKVILSESHSRKLKFEDLGRTAFIEACSLIFDDMMALYDPKVVYFGLAHTFQACIHNVYIPTNESPIMWFTGLTGTGKSALARIFTNFYGDFEGVISIQNTIKSSEASLMQFKDALYLLDDYKRGLTQIPEKVLVAFIQRVYDRSERGKLRKDGSQDKPNWNRSLLLVTGEDPPISDASVIARLLIVHFTKNIDVNKEGQERFNRISRTCFKLSGVMSRFIAYMLKTYPDPYEVHKRSDEIVSVMGLGVGSKQNAPRVVSNISANYLAFELMLEFFQVESILSKDQVEEMRNLHFENCKELREVMLKRCHEEQASNTFLETLSQLLNTGKYGIDGLTHYDINRVTNIGFFPQDGSGIIYLFPKIAYAAVLECFRSNNSSFTHDISSVAKQLVQDGIICRVNSDGSYNVRRTYHNSKVTVWAVEGKALGALVLRKEGSTESSGKYEEDDDLEYHGAKKEENKSQVIDSKVLQLM